jgi:hypothetical protein
MCLIIRGGTCPTDSVGTAPWLRFDTPSPVVLSEMGVVMSRLKGHRGHRTRKRPCRLGSTRSAFLPLPADCLVERVFVDVLIDIRFAPLGWSAGG